MSDASSTRMPQIAMGLAIVAVGVSLVAGVVVLTRGDDRVASPSPSSSMTPLLDHRVAASDIVKLRDQLEVIVEAGQPRGVRVKDAPLAKLLGLEPDDVLSAISGRAITKESDLADLILRAGSLRAQTLYAEVERAGAHVVLRWQLDGDLRDARRDALAQQIAGAGSGALGALAVTPGTLTNPFAADPLLDTIEKVDDTHYTVPRQTLFVYLATPDLLARGARIVPAIKNGYTDGFKLFAIRPDSAYARLGLQNGDTLRTVNGHKLAEVDDVYVLFKNMKNAPELRVELLRRGTPVELQVEITK